MQEFLLRTFLPLCVSLLTCTSAYVLGFFIVKRTKIAEQIGRVFEMGLSMLLGYGLLANITLILSLLGFLRLEVVWFICIILNITGYRYIALFIKNLKYFFGQLKLQSSLDNTFLILISFFCFFYLISAFVPPYETDAIAYHLPNAIQIAERGILSLSGYGIWAGNMPILQETLYGFLYKMYGFTLINLVNFQMLLAGLTVIFSFVKKEFNIKAGLVSVLFTLAFHPLLNHAINGYIDAAIFSYEMTAVILFLFWTKYNKRSFLLLSGSMYGLALASKYTPLYSLVLISALFIILNFKNKATINKFLFDVLYFLFPLVLLAGFWYFKNLILLGNPIYPFIFSHKGFSDKVLADAIFNIKFNTGLPAVYPNLLNFILMPFKLFWHPYYLTVLISFFIFPFGLLIKNNRQLFRLLMLFIFFYLTVWFFFMANSPRYALIGPVGLMMVAGIVLSEFCKYIKIEKSWPKAKYIFFVIFVILIITLFNFKNSHIFKIKKTAVEYALGTIDESEFYNRNSLGELYEASGYVNNNFTNTNILNNWDGFDLFLHNNNHYISFYDNSEITSNSDWLKICRFLKEQDISLLFINSDLRSKVLANRWTIVEGTTKTWHNLKNLEDIVAGHSSLIFEKFNGRLYSIGQCDK